MSSVTYFLLTDFLDLIASIKKKTFISFKIQNLGLKLDLFRTKSKEISDVLFAFENTSKTGILGVKEHILFHKSIFNH